MKFNLFAPTILALSFFSACTQALPAAPQNLEAVALLKRGAPNSVEAVVTLFLEAQTKVLAEACVDLQAKLCADVKVALNVKANLLDIIKTKINLNGLEIQAKAEADAEIKALIEAEAEVTVFAKIDAIVKTAIVDACSTTSDLACIKANAATIVAKVEAAINVNVELLIANIKAKLEVHVRARIAVLIKKVTINLLNILSTDISAIIRISADVDLHLKAFLGVCTTTFAKVGLVAKIAAL
ncbi:hypothetical protein BGZ65_000038 [Modicella reniformis]|uniref:Uncharacterized protein n=1 Tax=Modicella reniformis TaxID=1440133 RepID=A0A9P6MAG5_9FUNG|nr:hypothetical protein BGZ65_000038 [Modicella reniformis]